MQQATRDSDRLNAACSTWPRFAASVIGGTAVSNVQHTTASAEQDKSFCRFDSDSLISVIAQEWYSLASIVNRSSSLDT
jgi:hypothetical protein